MGFKLLVITSLIVICSGQFGQEPRIVNEGGRRNQKPFLLPNYDLKDFQLYEDVAVGTHVVTLRGQDPEGAPVSYTISGDHFSADRSSGKVTLVKKLDREEVSFIDVVVSVQDDQPDGITAVSRRIRGKNHRLSVILVKRIHTPQRIAFCIDVDAEHQSILRNQSYIIVTFIHGL